MLNVFADWREKLISLQVKPVFRSKPIGMSYIKQCTTERPNLVPVADDVYDILSDAANSISDPSSIVVKAMSLGVASFLADVSEW